MVIYILLLPVATLDSLAFFGWRRKNQQHGEEHSTQPKKKKKKKKKKKIKNKKKKKKIKQLQIMVLILLNVRESCYTSFFISSFIYFFCKFIIEFIHLIIV